MLINSVQGYANPQFQRKPNASEMKKYSKTVAEGLKVLDKKVGLIIHNSSVPSMSKQNIGIGSLLSKNAELAFIPFLTASAFSTIQQEPDNIRGKFDPSPYSPQSISKNIYMIPIERLATEEYGYLVSEEDIQKVVQDNAARKNPNKVDYQKTSENFEVVLTKAYYSLVNDKNNIQLLDEFEEYKKDKKEELQPNALYEILAKENNNEDWHTWSEEQRNLYVSEDKKPLEDILENYQQEIDYYMFKQWLVERETAKANERNAAQGINVIGDSPVAFTPVEVWMNQDLFMDGWTLGCPGDDYSDDGQRWGFAVLKPETIFNPDGSLGKGGELMRERYEKMFASSPGGARIDHIIGLIDPFVYTPEKPMNDEYSGRLYSSPNHPVLGKYAKHSDEEYASILEKIVFPAAEKYGLSKEDIICEDLGAVTDPVRNVMKKLNLSGISVTQFDYRGKDQPAKNIIMPGSHDNESYIEYTDKIFNDKRHLEEKTHKLMEDTNVPGEDWGHYKWQMQTDKVKFIASSFAELFTCPVKKIQLFFTTFFGIGKTYNKPGSTKDCWTLRLPENFDDLYWKNVKNGTAVNLPEAIARAIRNKGWDFANKHQNLLASLDEFTRILKD